MPTLSSSDNSINTLISTTADTEGADKTIDSLNKVQGAAGDTTKAGDTMADKFSDGMKKVSIASAAVAVGLTAYAKSATDYVVGLAKDSKVLARETGSTQEEASKLLAVTNRLGIGADQASTSFGILSKKIVENRDNTGEAADKTADLQNKMAATRLEINKVTNDIAKHGDKTGELKVKLDGLNITLKTYQKNLDEAADPLKKINVATVNADGSSRSFNDILFDISDRFKAMPDGVEKTALSMELFGRSGKDMIKVLNLGSDGIKELEANAEKMGLTLTKDNIVAVDKYIKSQKDLTDSSNALKIAVGNETIPVMTAFQQTVNGVVKSLIETDGPLKTAVVNVLAFGGPIAGAVSATTGFVANLRTAAPAAGAAAASVSAYGAAALGGVAANAALAFGLTNTQDKMHLTKTESLAMNEAILAVVGPASAMVTSMSSVFTLFGIGTGNANALKAAQDGLKNSTDSLKAANDSLRDSQLQQQQSSIAVEQATNAYNEAVARGGTGSLEARQAAVNLDVAKRNLEKSNQAVATAEENAKNKTNDNANAQKNLNGELAKNNGALSAHGGFWDSLAGKISNAANKAYSYVSSAANAAHALHIPGFATGVQNYSGGLAVVGERRPELVNLPRGSDVIPNNQMGNYSTSTSTVTIQNVILDGSAAVQSFFAQLDMDGIAISKGLTPARGGA